MVSSDAVEGAPGVSLSSRDFLNFLEPMPMKLKSCLDLHVPIYNSVALATFRSAMEGITPFLDSRELSLAQSTYEPSGD